MAAVNMYKVAPLVQDVKDKIKPADIMYHVDRIFKGSLSADTVAKSSSGDIVQTLTDLEGKIDEKIALRRLNTLESKLDGWISKLGVPESGDKNKSSKNSKKESKKDTKKAKQAPPAPLPKVQPVSLPKKTIPAASLTTPSNKNLDLVIQVSPQAEPVFLLAAIRSLQLAKSNVCIRLHYHSSVIKQDEAGYKFNSLFSAFDLKCNDNISRLVQNFDYVFTFLITNKLEKNVDVDCCLNGAKHASIVGDVCCSRFVWKLAGGAYCDECDYWSDLVQEVVNDKKQLASVQAEIKKNFGKGSGRFCDVAVAILS